MKTLKKTGAILLVQCLEAQGVEFIFGVPGAKIDSVYDALNDSSIRLIHCRHEQNAAFMAASYGRITGKPGVVLVTSGPGVSNLATGLLTATTEGDPVVALGGNVSRALHLKSSHQGCDNVGLLKAATKLSVEIESDTSISETLIQAFRESLAPRRGAVFISLPQDIIASPTDVEPLESPPPVLMGEAPIELQQVLLDLLTRAKRPVILLGQGASEPTCTQALRAFLKRVKIPVVCTFQGAGVVSRDLIDRFFGRIGLFKNQPGDQVLDQADLLITVGFNPVEYDPEIWNTQNQKAIVHIDCLPAQVRSGYSPSLELLGDMSKTLMRLTSNIESTLAASQLNQPYSKALCALHAALHQQLDQIHKTKNADPTTTRIHPLDFIHHLRSAIDDQTRVISDVGSHYMWLGRYFLSYEPHHLLFSNGQQTLGVALPWAMASLLAEPHKRVISISGDGGFLFSGVELETAVREHLPVLHFVWDDGSYNMVREQQLMKYHRDSGVKLGPVDFALFAQSLGATGWVLERADQIPDLLTRAQAISGPVLVHVKIDYQDNPQLFKTLHESINH